MGPGLTKANFLGIGAQKCATTWLYDILSDHPQVCLSSEKEVDFFSYYYDFGMQWYGEKFTVQAGETAIGEVSPSYFHVPGVPERVHTYHPAMRLILFLREPVQRAVSNHKHEVRIGHLAGDDLSFEYGLENNPMYIEQGLYATHYERWLQYFPREQILVVLFDDVSTSAAAVARQVYRFLGIDESHGSRVLGQQSNKSYVTRFGALESAKNSIRSVVRRVGLGRVWQLIGKSGLKQAYGKLNRLPPEAIIPPAKSQTIERLRQVFRPEIVRLQSLTGIDLSNWYED